MHHNDHTSASCSGKKESRETIIVGTHLQSCVEELADAWSGSFEAVVERSASDAAPQVVCRWEEAALDSRREMRRVLGDRGCESKGDRVSWRHQCARATDENPLQEEAMYLLVAAIATHPRR